MISCDLQAQMLRGRGWSISQVSAAITALAYALRFGRFVGLIETTRPA